MDATNTLAHAVEHIDPDSAADPAASDACFVLSNCMIGVQQGATPERTAGAIAAELELLAGRTKDTEDVLAYLRLSANVYRP